jgi:DHA3 family macrolide efflux protein-like MFS transporter
MNQDPNTATEQPSVADEAIIAPDAQPELPDKWLKNYLPMGVGQILSMLGSGLVHFALIWFITKETGSAITLLMATITGVLPSVILGPFAGALVDRWNRKLTMIISDGVIALATLLLAFLFAIGKIQIWHVYAILFIRSVGGIFQSPAMSASITLMVPREHYTRLAGVSHAVDGIITIVSPPLGALLMSLLPIQAVIAVDIVTAAIAILLLLMVKIPQPPKQKSEKVATSIKTVLTDVKDGFAYVISWKGIFAAMIGGTLINMTAAPSFSLLPLHVDQFFQKGSDGLAFLYSALGVGSIVGGLVLSVWGGFKRKILTVVTGIFSMGLGMLAFGFLPAQGYTVAVFITVFLGIANAFANGPLSALFQDKIPPELQGRVFTVMGSLVQATVPIGLLIAAPIAEWLGISAWFIIGGTACVVLAIVMLLYKPMATLDWQGPGGEILPEYQDRV